MTDCCENGNDSQIHKDSHAWRLLINEHGGRLKQEDTCSLSFNISHPCIRFTIKYKYSL